MSLPQMIGFEMAGREWGQRIQDNTTINIHVGMARSQDLPEGVIGGALPGFNTSHEIEQVQAALSADISSADDTQAVQNLPINSASSSYDNDPDIRAVLEQHAWNHNDDLAITTANAKALKLNNPQSTVDLDGFILMSDLAQYDVDWNYDYGRVSTPSSNSLDFLSVAMHEIGHILGFVSSPDSARVADWQADNETNQSRLNATTPLDLFRYSSWSRQYNAVDLAAGVQTYLSTNGGQSAIGYFARGKIDLGLGSDGFQTSHWNGGTSSGLMDPFLALGERSNIETIDLRALDIIGYDRTSQASLNYSQLLAETKAALADRLGVSVSTLDASPGVIADLLASDRFGDVLQMIEDSEIYARRKSKKAKKSELWQEWAGASDVFEVFQQEALFSSLGEGDTTNDGVSLGQNIALSLQRTYSRIPSNQDLPLTLTGSLEGDVLDGSGDSDWLGGFAQADVLNGSAGDDFLFGNGGADVLRGNGGDDQLFGGIGGDRLMGGHGNDGLVGGIGSDRLSGGVGADAFMVEALAGTDIVYDFTDGEDRLTLAPGLSSDQLTILDASEIHLESLGLDLPANAPHTVISHGDTPLMVLLNVDAGLITDADIG